MVKIGREDKQRALNLANHLDESGCFIVKAAHNPKIIVPD